MAVKSAAPKKPAAKKPAVKKPVAAKPAPVKATPPTPAAKPVAKKPVAKAPVKPAPVKSTPPTPAAKPAAKAPVKPAVKAPAKPKTPVTPPPAPKAAVVKKSPAPSASAKSPAVLPEGAAAAEHTVERQLANLREDMARLRRENADLLRSQNQFFFRVMEQTIAAQLQMVQSLAAAAKRRNTVIKAVPDEEPSNVNTVTIRVTEEGYALSVRVPGKDGEPVSFAEVTNDEIDTSVITAFLNTKQVKPGDVLHANVYLF